MTADYEKIQEVYGDRAARRYRALTDIKQVHLSEFQSDFEP